MHTHINTAKMADEANLLLESAFSTLLTITEKSGNLRKDLKRDIVDSVSTLRNIFVNLNNSVEEQMARIGLLASEVKKGRRSFTCAEPLTYQHSTRHLGTGPENSSDRREARAAIGWRS
jgi:hypothetical protein